MIDDKDFTIDNRYKKKFKATCDSCGGDRGYKRKEDSSMPCLKCALKIRNIKYGFRNPHSYKNVDPSDFVSLKGNTKKYRTSYSACSRDRGYRQLKNVNKLCRSCTAKRRPSRVQTTKVQRKLRHNMKSNMNRKLKLRNLSKDGKSIFGILPYTLSDLIKHLESKFLPNMTWDNYGYYGWHIDHIKPDCLFNYSSYKDADFLQSWSLENLQPLWAKDNLSKSNKYPLND